MLTAHRWIDDPTPRAKPTGMLQGESSGNSLIFPSSHSVGGSILWAMLLDIFYDQDTLQGSMRKLRAHRPENGTQTIKTSVDMAPPSNLWLVTSLHRRGTKTIFSCRGKLCSSLPFWILISGLCFCLNSCVLMLHISDLLGQMYRHKHWDGLFFKNF